MNRLFLYSILLCSVVSVALCLLVDDVDEWIENVKNIRSMKKMWNFHLHTLNIPVDVCVSETGRAYLT